MNMRFLAAVATASLQASDWRVRFLKVSPVLLRISFGDESSLVLFQEVVAAVLLPQNKTTPNDIAALFSGDETECLIL